MSAPAHAVRPRQTRPLGVEEVRGWSLKWYEINVEPEPIDEVIVMAARDLVRATAYLSDVITVEAEVPA